LWVLKIRDDFSSPVFRFLSRNLDSPNFFIRNRQSLKNPPALRAVAAPFMAAKFGGKRSESRLRSIS
jgi:hypothetical protein